MGMKIVSIFLILMIELYGIKKIIKITLGIR